MPETDKLLPSLSDILTRQDTDAQATLPCPLRQVPLVPFLAVFARRYGQARSARTWNGLVVLLKNLEGHIRPPTFKIFGLHVHGLLLVSDRLPIKASTVFITFDAESVFVAIPAVFPGRLAH